MVSVTSDALMPRVRWSWLWSQRSDITWNLLPFWLSFGLVAILFAARNLGGPSDNPVWNFAVNGRQVHLAAWLMYLYGPLVDAPHLWATIARTYADKDEWAARRKLFLVSFLWFVVGPAIILIPYALRAAFHLSPGIEVWGWVVWSNFFTFYALFHINKQHWGFIALYKRKNGDSADPRENRVDSLFFTAAIWLPYVAMLTAPWYVDFDGKPFFAPQVTSILHGLCHVTFFTVCVAYVAFQIDRWRKGNARNGPKLLYIATVIPLNYLAFAIHPLLAAFWVIITGVGHCAQYHRVVWAYGHSKYAGKTGEARRLPSKFFENVALYAVLGVAFGILTLQGPGSGAVKDQMASLLQAGFFQHAFDFLAPAAGVALGVKVAAAFISGVRLHHFYVDSKIWRVSKSKELAKNLNV
jgi:hypothetical protein